MLEEGKNILKYHHGDKSLRVPLIIYADLECLPKKEQSCQNNPKNSYAERKAKHKPSGYSLSLICSFHETKNSDTLLFATVEISVLKYVDLILLIFCLHRD